MRKRMKIALTVVLVAAVGLAMWAGLRAKEPAYQGKPLRYYICTLQVSDQNLPAFPSNAVPHLVKYLKKRETPWGRLYGATWRRLPTWAQSRVPYPMEPESVRYRAMKILMNMDAVQPALPDFVRILEQDDCFVCRFLAALSLCKFVEHDPRVKKALIQAALKDNDITVRQAAARSLTVGHATGQEVAEALRALESDLDRITQSSQTNTRIPQITHRAAPAVDLSNALASLSDAARKFSLKAPDDRWNETYALMSALPKCPSTIQEVSEITRFASTDYSRPSYLLDSQSVARLLGPPVFEGITGDGRLAYYYPAGKDQSRQLWYLTVKLQGSNVVGAGLENTGFATNAQRRLNEQMSDLE